MTRLLSSCAFFGALLFSLSCGADNPTLQVDLRTDFVPGVEFVEIRTELSLLPRTAGAQDLVDRVTVNVTDEDDARDGLRIAELTGRSGMQWVYVELLTEEGEVLARRPVSVELEGDLGILIIITRDCEGVECPNPGGDPGAIACLAGECVDSRCRPGALEFCGGTAGCGADSDCASFAECADARCLEGVCFAAGDPSACEVGEWCHPDLGCLDEGTREPPPECRRVECVLPNECEIGLLSCDGERICEPAGLVFTGRDCDTGACSEEGSCLGYLLTVNASGPGVVASDPTGITCGEECSARFDRDVSVTLSAIPMEGARLVSWEGECEPDEEGRCAFRELTGPAEVSAIFEFTEHRIVVTGDGDGMGSVSGGVVGADSEIDCGAMCETVARYGDSVTIRATPGPDSVFAGWSSDVCTGSDPVCTFVVRGDASIGATFTRGIDNLVVARAGSGTGRVVSTPAGIDCGATCVGSYPRSTAVTLLAEAGPGSRFVGFTGDCDALDPECTLIVRGPRSVTARFERIRHEVTVRRVGEGTVRSVPVATLDCGDTCVAEFDEGASVQLVATPAPGYDFVGFRDPSCRGTGPCTITVDVPKTIVATFMESPFSLDVTRDGTGSGTVVSSPEGIGCGGTCSALFAPRTVVALEAVPDPGSVFVGFAGDCIGPRCEVVMDAPRGVRATFAIGYPLNISFDPLGPPGEEGSGTVNIDPLDIACPSGSDCENTIVAGTTVTLRPVADDGFVFSHWTGDCMRRAPCTSTMSRARNVTAHFNTTRELCWTTRGRSTGTGFSPLGGAVRGTGTCVRAEIPRGTSRTLDYGSMARLSVNLPFGSVLTGWNGDGSCTGTELQCIMTMDRDRDVIMDIAYAPNSVHVRVSGVAEGASVVSRPPGIDCPGDCVAFFEPGERVTLTAVGAGFFDWQGTSCTGADPMCTFVAGEAVDVQARFRRTSD